LIANILEEEVREAVWQCERSKSSGPNGFNFNFIKGCWETIKQDVLQVVQSFDSSGNIPRGCN